MYDICVFVCVCVLLCSIFEGGAIPYPKRDFLAEDEPEDKADTGAKRPNCDNVSNVPAAVKHKFCQL